MNRKTVEEHLRQAKSRSGLGMHVCTAAAVVVAALMDRFAVEVEP